MNKRNFVISLVILISTATLGCGEETVDLNNGGNEEGGCVDGGAPLDGESTVIVWDGNLCITDGVRINLLKDLGGRTGVGDLTKIGTDYFFVSENDENGDELWKSDGTKEGTMMLKDIRPGESSSDTKFLTNVNGTLFFVAAEVEYADELWKSDGTTEGTVMVKDIYPGAEFGSNPIELTEMGGKVYFRATDPVNAVELWVSDGTEEGTKIVKNIQAEEPNDIERSSSFPSNLVSIGDTLLFRVTSSTVEGFDLWTTDGTEANTVPIKTIEQNANAFAVGNTALIGNVVYFVVLQDESNLRELWKSDGTDAGTVKVKDIDCSPLINGFEFTAVNDLLYFKIADNTKGFSELWKSDGTEAGTVVVRSSPSWEGLFAQPLSLTNVNGTLFFSADSENNPDPIAGPRLLWKSDGTEAGTLELGTGVESQVEILGQVAGTLLFEAEAKEGVGFRNDFLWKSDGSESGTVKVTIK